MKFTALVVEIFVGGLTAQIWLLLALYIIYEPDLDILTELMVQFKDYSGLLVFVYVGLTYVLGWIAHFLGESTLDLLFQSRFRDRLFAKKGIDFFLARTEIFQNGSSGTFADIQYDRQLLRIARTNLFNFLIISFIFIIYAIRYKSLFYLPLVVVSSGIAFLCFIHWKLRYTATFKKMLDMYTLIKKDKLSNRKK